MGIERERKRERERERERYLQLARLNTTKTDYASITIQSTHNQCSSTSSSWHQHILESTYTPRHTHSGGDTLTTETENEAHSQTGRH